jgi:hypothetical protein
MLLLTDQRTLGHKMAAVAAKMPKPDVFFVSKEMADIVRDATPPAKARRARGMVGAAQKGDDGRPDLDFYPTPPEATLALLRTEWLGERIWEPACGDGAMVKVMRANDWPVVASDIHDYGFPCERLDFLKADRLLAPIIVTNPPFVLANQFARHALDLGAEKVCLLLRLAFLEGQRREDLHRRLSRVLVFRKRLTLWRDGVRPEDSKGGGMIAFAWFVWDRKCDGPTTVSWI